MKTVKISLNSIDKVKAFVNDVTNFNTDFDLVSGRYVIDAKSIMGIFSLDLSKAIDLNIHDDDNIDEILKTLAPYIVEKFIAYLYEFPQEFLGFSFKRSTENTFGVLFFFALLYGSLNYFLKLPYSIFKQFKCHYSPTVMISTVSNAVFTISSILPTSFSSER